MGTFYWLATEAAELAVEEGGSFGFNFDILESNIINLAIVIALLIYFGRGFLGKTLGDRRNEIETRIQEAEQRKRQAAEQLANEQQKLAQAQQEAKRIREAAEASAQAAKAEILARADQEIARLRETAAQDTTATQERAIAQLRQQVVSLALKQVEGELQQRLGQEDSQRQLVDRSITLLGA